MKFLEYLLLERNVLNIGFLDRFIQDFCNEIEHDATMNHADDLILIKWAKSNLRNYLIRDYPSVNRVDYSRVKGLRVDREPWIQRAIKRGDELFDVVIRGELYRQMHHIKDYFRANPNINLSRMSVPEAIRQSEQWLERLNKKSSIEEDSSGIQEVRSYSGGFKWVKVTSQQALNREGKLMKHCVGSYYNLVQSEKTSIYSLRDKNNMPHCTIEIKQHEIKQIKGKANGAIDKKYVKYVKDFVLKPVIGEKYDKVQDLRNIGLIQTKHGNIYDLYNLPENLKIDDDLVLADVGKISLPKNLTVNFVLDISFNKEITSLPENLTVGTLDIQKTNITTVPSSIKILYHLYAMYSGLTSLPKGLKTGGNLNLRGCTSLTSLPENLMVGGNLAINYSSITSLPKGLKVGGWLDITDTKILTLPNDLEVGGSIFVDYDKIHLFQDGSKFASKISN